MSADFLDSNLFIYLFDETAPAKRHASAERVESALRTGNGIISFQVVQETLNVITGKLATPMGTGDARRFLNAVLAPLWQIMPSTDLYDRALGVRERYRYGFYDSLIIAAALMGGCRRLLSEDLQAGQKVDGLLIVNPFENP